MSMTNDKQTRKESPIARGVLDYFPLAIAAVANVSFIGNQQHNPREEMHWSRNKSADHADCIARHLLDRGQVDDDGLRHSAKVAWRALALLQLELEENQARENAREFRKHLEAVKADCGESTNGEAEAEVGGTAEPCEIGNTIYVAGPMRGCVDFNFPAFDAARDHLRIFGWHVISPADIDREQGLSDSRGYAKRDCKAILEWCGAIYMLKGWQHSVGASAEHAVAKWAGLAIHYQEKQR